MVDFLKHPDTVNTFQVSCLSMPKTKKLNKRNYNDLKKSKKVSDYLISNKIYQIPK